MSDRAAWLEEWCPECRAAPGARCSLWRWGRGSRGRVLALPYLHPARGWLEPRCPTCKASSGERCSTPTGRQAARVHVARLRPTRGELVGRSAVWDELERLGAVVVVVPFSGRGSAGGMVGAVGLFDANDKQLATAQRDRWRDELCFALEAPIWERFGIFTGHPLVRGEVIWSTDDRRVRVRGTRGGRPFEELTA